MVIVTNGTRGVMQAAIAQEEHREAGICHGEDLLRS